MTEATPLSHALDLAMQVDPVAENVNCFVGGGRDYGPLKIYGGHLLGQGLAAAFATVDQNRLAHSLHAYFLKVGEANAPITYEVERLREGRNYVVRGVRALQDDALLLVMMASFKQTEFGDEHQPVAPEMADPETLRSARKARGDEAIALPFAAPFGIELEADGWHPRAPAGGEPAISMWMRAPMSVAADARARQCALAYLSDGSMMFNAVRPYGNAFASHRAASLDHSVWFHRDADPENWLLFDQRSTVATDARGLNNGHIYNAAGLLCASVTQESMLRRI